MGNGAVQKLKRATELKDESPLTANVKCGRSKEYPVRDATLVQTLITGVILANEMRTLKEQQEGINEFFRNYVGELDGDAKTVKITAEYMEIPVEVAVTSNDKVVITNVEGLSELLGDRFADLVAVKTDYKPEKKLVEMAADGDGEDVETLRGLLKIKEGKARVAFGKIE